MDNIVNRLKMFDGSMLKLIAVVTMLIDHIGLFVLPYVLCGKATLFVFLGREISLYFIFKKIGRIAFPIYCFLISEGLRYTHNRKKYGANLLIFALISQIPWSFAFTGTPFYTKLNVMFTLFFGFLGVCLFDYYSNKPVIRFCSLFLILVIPAVIKMDYGSKGFLLIFLFYILREKRVAQSIVGVILLDEGLTKIYTFIPIMMYNGKRGFINNKTLKYIFYSFYPVHLLILAIIKYKFLK